MAIVLRQTNCARGYVYVLECQDTKAVKIGMTRSHWQKRVQNLQTANSSKLELVYVFETPLPLDLEAHLHFQFKKQWIRGEWFTNQILQSVEFLAQQRGCIVVKRKYRKILQD